MCFPHTRGDGPQQCGERDRQQRFSPHAWGWSGPAWGFSNRFNVFPTRVGMVRRPADRRRQKVVFPTRVGMVRQRRRRCAGAASFPHTRGDGPDIRQLSEVPVRFSPHAWGWSVGGGEIRRRHFVFPTRVGMVRTTLTTGEEGWRFPHTRGDGPHAVNGFIRELVFSPHAWGWSADLSARNRSSPVFPTRVGMVRWSRPIPSPPGCFPHTRGDGPWVLSR